MLPPFGGHFSAGVATLFVWWAEKTASENFATTKICPIKLDGQILTL